MAFHPYEAADRFVVVAIEVKSIAEHLPVVVVTGGQVVRYVEQVEPGTKLVEHFLIGLDSAEIAGQENSIGFAGQGVCEHAVQSGVHIQTHQQFAGG